MTGFGHGRAKAFHPSFARHVRFSAIRHRPLHGPSRGRRRRVCRVSVRLQMLGQPLHEWLLQYAQRVLGWHIAYDDAICAAPT